MNNKTHMNTKSKQQGLSLIELMIAMLIGLFLLTGIATSYLSSQKSSTKRNEIITLEDNGRIALEVLSQIIERAGYTPPGGSILNPPFIKNSSEVVSGSCSTGSSIVNQSLFTSALTTKDSVAGTTGDTIVVAYNGDARVFTDCSGGELPAGCQVDSSGNPSTKSVIYNAFYLQNKELRCVGSRDNKYHVIAENIEAVQYLYGIDTSGNGDVDKYINASALGSTEWNSVVSVQIAVLVKSAKKVRQKKSQTNYTLLDKTFSAPDDKFQRAVFTTTIRIRNTL